MFSDPVMSILSQQTILVTVLIFFLLSSLSSVEPPQVWFDLKLPPHVIEEAMLSSLQLEAVVYASQQHMNILTDGSRAGFLIGEPRTEGCEVE